MPTFGRRGQICPFGVSIDALLRTCRALRHAKREVSAEIRWAKASQASHCVTILLASDFFSVRTESSRSSVRTSGVASASDWLLARPAGSSLSILSSIFWFDPGT